MIVSFRASTVTVLVLAGVCSASRALAQTPPPAPAEQQQFEEKLNQVFGHPGGLTSDDVARRAAASSADVAGKGHERAAADEEIERAKTGWAPRLTLSARYARLSPIDQPALGNIVVAPTVPQGPIPPGSLLVNVPLSFPVILNQYTLQANLTVPISDYALRIGQSVASASRSREAADLAERAALKVAGADARVAYYNWVRAKLQLVVAEQTVVQAKAHQDAVAASFDANRASRADVLRAESARAQAELFVDRAGNAVTSAEDQLATLMHDLRRTGAYSVGESMAVPAPSADERASLDQLYAEAASRRLELKALESSARAFDEQRRVSDAGNYPRLDAFGNAYYANPNQRYFPQKDEWHATWDVGIQLTWTPNDVASSGAASRALGERAEALRAQRAALNDAIHGEILRAREGLADARAALAATQRSRAAAEEAYRVQKELYAYGKATNVELVDAETDLLRARLDSVNALVDLEIAEVRLQHALGR